MSEENQPTEETPADQPTVDENTTETEATIPEEVAPGSKKECPSSPTKEHDMFHNEGTDETYCRYCGKT